MGYPFPAKANARDVISHCELYSCQRMEVIRVKYAYQLKEKLSTKKYKLIKKVINNVMKWIEIKCMRFLNLKPKLLTRHLLCSKLPEMSFISKTNSKQTLVIFLAAGLIQLKNISPVAHTHPMLENWGRKLVFGKRTRKKWSNQKRLNLTSFVCWRCLNYQLLMVQMSEFSRIHTAFSKMIVGFPTDCRFSPLNPWLTHHGINRYDGDFI